MLRAELTRVAVLFVLCQGFILASGFCMFAMIGEVNRKLPEERRVSYLFGSPLTTLRLFREYRQLYPHGRLRSLFFLLFGVGILLGIAAAWQLGMF